MAPRSARLRRQGRDRVGVARARWRARQARLGGERTGPNPTDRARKGRSDRSLPRARGIPLGIESASASVNDFKLTRRAPRSSSSARPRHARVRRALSRPRLRLRRARARGRVRLHVSHPLPRRAGASAQARGRLPCTSLGRRAHPLLAHRFRRVLVRWEKRADTYLAMLHLACALLTWRAIEWGA